MFNIVKKIKSLVTTLKKINLIYDKINTICSFINYINYENVCLKYNYNEFSSITTKCRPKIYFLNDTTRDTNHPGCSLVCHNFKYLLDKYEMDIIFSDTLYGCNLSTTTFNEIISKSDAIVFNGEGTLHDCNGLNMYEKCITAKNYGKKIFLLNTVWQKNYQINDVLQIFDIITCRESFSYNAIPDEYKCKAFICPDLSFYDIKPNKSDNKSRKIVITDSVLPDVTEKLKNIAKYNNFEFYYLFKNENNDSKYLSQSIINNLSQNSLVVTGRFHALTFCIKYGIPCLAIPSNTHKIQGLLHDCNLENFLLKNIYDWNYNFLNEQKNLEFMQKSLKYVKNAKFSIEFVFYLLNKLLYKS